MATASTERSSTYLRSPDRFAVVALSLLTMAVSYFDRQTLAAVAPLVTAELGISERAYALVSSTFSIAYLVFAPLAGIWVDRIGARRALLFAFVCWSCVAAAHALVGGLVSLLVVRALLGIAEAPAGPSVGQAVRRAMKPSERPTAYAILFTGSSLGAALAPPISVSIASTWGWRAAFLATAVAGVLWLPLWLWGTRGDVALAVAPEPQRVAFGRFALLRHGPMLRGMVGMLATAPLVSFVFVWGAKYLVTSFDVSPDDVGGYLWVPPIGRDVGGIGFGLIAASALGRSHYRVLFGVAAAMCAVVVAAPSVASPWAAIALWVVAMAGSGGAMALTIAELMAWAPQGARSFVWAVATTVQSLGFVLANFSVGEIAARIGGYDVAVYALAAFAVCGMVAWVFWPKGADGNFDASDDARLTGAVGGDGARGG